MQPVQRAWLKARDAGLQIYLATFPPAEKERRRLQFSADVSRAEAEVDEEAVAVGQSCSSTTYLGSLPACNRTKSCLRRPRITNNSHANLLL